MKKIYFFVLILILICIFLFRSSENFTIDSDTLIFKKLNDNLIKGIKISTSNNISEQEVLNLFKNDDIIKIVVPPNYSTNLIYKFKDGGYSRTIILPDGTHDIKKIIDNEIINIIETKYNFNAAPSKRIIVANKLGQILFETDSDRNINWELVYSDYGLDDYYVVYPWGRRLYYYYNIPYYRRSRSHYRRPGKVLFRHKRK